jgi:hypothetical protein
MVLKKAEYTDDEIPLYEEALVYKRGEYWQMRMWLAKEHKYARFSLASTLARSFSITLSRCAVSAAICSLILSTSDMSKLLRGVVG